MDLTDKQWAVLEPIFRPNRRPDGRGRPWAVDAAVMQRAVDAYPALLAAINHRLTTTDHALAALGAPNVATLAEGHRKALAAHEEALRLWA